MRSASNQVRPKGWRPKSLQWLELIIAILPGEKWHDVFSSVQTEIFLVSGWFNQTRFNTQKKEVVRHCTFPHCPTATSFECRKAREKTGIMSSLQAKQRFFLVSGWLKQTRFDTQQKAVVRHCTFPHCRVI
jgi:hypothetical protein